jgi:hypothetical protein
MVAMGERRMVEIREWKWKEYGREGERRRGGNVNVANPSSPQQGDRRDKVGGGSREEKEGR